MQNFESGRINQKRRTREALVKAAAELLHQGKTPTVVEVADVARISAATAYRYFPSQDLLLLEAAVEPEVVNIQQALASKATSIDPVERIDTVLRAMHTNIATDEMQYRMLLRLLITQPFSGENNDVGLRAARRLHWIKEALAPAQSLLDEQSYQRLVAGLALCMGTEAFTVLRDICGLNAGEAEQVERWVARTLIQASLLEKDALNSTISG